VGRGLVGALAGDEPVEREIRQAALVAVLS
jgi:hypothetical protein